MEIEANLG